MSVQQHGPSYVKLDCTQQRMQHSNFINGTWMSVLLELQMKLGKHEKQFKVGSWIRGHHIRLVDTRALLTDTQNKERGCELSLQAYRVDKMQRSLTLMQVIKCNICAGLRTRGVGRHGLDTAGSFVGILAVCCDDDDQDCGYRYVKPCTFVR